MSKPSTVIDYDKIANAPAFQSLAKKKNRFLWTCTALFFIAYILLPILTSYTTLLHQNAIGDIPWVWVYAAGLFIMTWSLAHFYVWKAAQFDQAAKAIIAAYESEETK